MKLTTSQIARVLGCNAVNAWKAIRRWEAEGVSVETTPTGGRPALCVDAEEVAFRAGLDVDDVLALAGVEMRAAA